jgi:Zn-dependent protease with chaperone function
LTEKPVGPRFFMSGTTHAAFVAKLRRLLLLAQAHPTAYRYRVRAWGLLGYAGMYLPLLVAAGLLAKALWTVLAAGVWELAFFLALPFGVVWKIQRALWVKIDPPTGRALGPAEAGPLHGLLREQTLALGAPAVHSILLTTSYNAAAVQLPRLGLLGWPRNYVLVGLPLLQTLTPEQAAAVVAHELGHLRGGHGRFGAWVYRVHKTWAQLLGQLERNGRRSLVRPVVGWYVRQFRAWSHPLRRVAELEADAAAARLTSPATLAEALCALRVRHAALAQLYWEPLEASVAHEPAPPPAAISQLLPVARTAHLPDEEAAVLLRQAVEADPDPFDTHPTLGERLAALGQPAAVPALPAITAAEAWLGPNLPALAQALDAEWAAARAAAWHERHTQLRAELTALTEELALRPPSPEAEAWQLAQHTEAHQGAAEALPLYRALLDAPAHRVAAHFAVGRLLLAQDDAAGLPLLEEAMAAHPDHLGPGLALQLAYYQRRGNHADLDEHLARQRQHAALAERMQAERQGCSPQDGVLAHGLPDADLAAVRAVLARPAHRVAQAWLLRKRLTYFAAEKPFFLLLVRVHRGPGLSTDEEIMAWVWKLTPSLVVPGAGMVVPVIRPFFWLGKRALRLPGAEIYHAEAS